MSLKKNVATKYGVDGSLHKIISIKKTVEDGIKKCLVTVGVFANKNGEAMQEKTYLIDDVNSFGQAYAELKKKTDYIDAIDDVEPEFLGKK